MALTLAPPRPGGAPPAIGWTVSLRAMLRWHAVSLRMWFPVLLAVQVLAGVGFVLGIGLFFADIPQQVALYVSTGVPVINLLMVGMILGPQLIAQQKVQGSYEYLQAMPVPRSVSAFAWYLVCLAGGVPAVAVTLAVAQWRYDLPLRLTPAVVPAVLVICFCGTMLGLALGHAVPSPMATQLITQLLVFVIFGFAPITFPASRLPQWLATLNWWLPFEHMAVVMRAAFTVGLVTGVASSYVNLAVWSVLCAALVAWVLARRR